MKVRDKFDMDGRIILKGILKTWGVRVLTGFICLRQCPLQVLLAW
jgi:hypothetical protein